MVSCKMSCWPSSLVFFCRMLNSLRWWFTDCSVRWIKKTNVQSLYWSFGFIDIQHKCRPRVTKYKKNTFWFHIFMGPLKSFLLHWKSIMTANDSIKCWCANSGMTAQVGGFQNPRVCLQALPSFLPHPLPALSLTPFFTRFLTLVPRSLLLNRTETLATQASVVQSYASL